ncbi:hypothetical protein BZA05DRAFT_150034 [Tricharina praecox]|uniref:uncharacterized protein n=1 Tax=Tricharina praecox TaxID=43433 RepID=UPI00221E62E7|nr:uncharacterized protein BZA05DRAFT_150034 [Tricharina praecox]KAI5845423.1 hypothetical protein BZA05DRAFT_150034 [Tricharina praecox]
MGFSLTVSVQHCVSLCLGVRLRLVIAPSTLPINMDPSIIVFRCGSVHNCRSLWITPSLFFVLARSSFAVFEPSSHVSKFIVYCGH